MFLYNRMSVSLREAYLRSADSNAAAVANVDGDVLERTLAELCAKARAECADIDLSPALFAAHVARHWGHEPPERWAPLRAADLWLACACAAGDERAVVRFEAQYRAILEQVVARMRLSPDRAADVKQLVRDRLLVGEPGKASRIASYSGRGELAGWVRAAATRVALNFVRDEPTARSDDELLDRLPAGADDPELQMLKSRYTAPFRAAFRGALAALDARARLLLKQHYIDGLSTDELGTLYRVHRVTVLRWITDARERVATDAEARVASLLGVPKHELASLVRLVRSRIDLSLHNLLAAD